MTHSTTPSPAGAGTVAVVGAGLAGLAAAHRLRQRGQRVIVFDAADAPGGVVRSERRDGFLVDLGPNTVVARRPELPALIRELGIEDEVVRANDAAQRRYVVRDSQPHPLPDGPAAFLRTPLFSARAKLRLLAEPLIPRWRQPGDPSLAAFVRRRLGREILDYAVDPFVGGVFAGDPTLLAARHAFPALWTMEQTHGSFLRGGVAAMRAGRGSSEARPDRTPFSFRDGMGTLPRALATPLASSLFLNSPVEDVVPNGSGFTVRIAGRASGEQLVDGVVIALPPTHLARLNLLDAQQAAAIRNVPTPPVTVLALGFRREDVGHALDGFGMLVPSREPHRLLGALFSSTLFPGRAPDGHVLLTCFLGGRRHPEDALLAEDAQVELAMRDLRALLGASGEPVFALRHVWPEAIPQYEGNHAHVEAALESLEEAHPRLAVAGSIRGGISVPDTVASGLAAGDRLADALGDGL
jgi:protoporphyrinogen/coproporphyrinogen III oxidase